MSGAKLSVIILSPHECNVTHLYSQYPIFDKISHHLYGKSDVQKKIPDLIRYYCSGYVTYRFKTVEMFCCTKAGAIINVVYDKTQ